MPTEQKTERTWSSRKNERSDWSSKLTIELSWLAVVSQEDF